MRDDRRTVLKLGLASLGWFAAASERWGEFDGVGLLAQLGLVPR